MSTNKSNKNHWEQVEWIQSCIKDWFGVGTPIVIHYFAPLDETTPDEVMTYDISWFDKEVIPKDKKFYVNWVIQKICYYISMIYNYEILKMKVFFL